LHILFNYSYNVKFGSRGQGSSSICRFNESSSYDSDIRPRTAFTCVFDFAKKKKKKKRNKETRVKELDELTRVRRKFLGKSAASIPRKRDFSLKRKKQKKKKKKKRKKKKTAEEQDHAGEILFSVALRARISDSGPDCRIAEHFIFSLHFSSGFAALT